MQKNFLKTLPLAFLATSMVVSGLTACSSSDDSIAEEPTPVVNPTQTNVHQVRIHATMGGDAQTRAVNFDGTTSYSIFQTTEEVYVYNVTKKTMLSGTLSPTNISEDGKSCDLTGELTGTIEANDELRLFYNFNNYSTTNDLYYNHFDYTRQTGAATTVLDGAEATVTVSDFANGTLSTVATASFQNLQSMFRQSLTFKDASGETVTPTITSLKVKSKNNKLIWIYAPLYEEQTNTYNPLSITNPVIDANGDIYLSLRFVGSDGTDALTFTAQDSEGNIYECTKNAPSGGFQNGKYYHGSMTLPFVRKVNQPIVTGTSVKTDAYNRYDIYDDPTNITISGTSVGYYFRLRKVSTVTLNGINATHEGHLQEILEADKDINLIINGTNSFCCPNSNDCIYTASGNLKISGNGTLTVTAKKDNRYGLFATNYNEGGNNSNANVLAAEGYTVTRSARTDNNDGTYTWTYTVTTAE